jgi:hypothetical protein
MQIIPFGVHCERHTNEQETVQSGGSGTWCIPVLSPSVAVRFAATRVSLATALRHLLAGTSRACAVNGLACGGRRYHPCRAAVPPPWSACLVTRMPWW